MNQILVTKSSRNTRKRTYISQFFLIIIIICLLIIDLILKTYSKNKSQKISSIASKEYSVLHLYSANVTPNLAIESQLIKVIGTLEIPEINISYPIFSECSDELLKISLCKFYGPNLNESGNLCIAGHNYDNGKFFSNLFLLNTGSKIIIYDKNLAKSIYIVYSKYEIMPSDLSCILQNTDRA